MQKTSYYIINGITLYRVLASVVLLVLIIQKQLVIFKWLLAFSFFTDSIDGFLAGRYHVVSKLGSRLDSLGDDLTVLMGIIAIMVFRPEFFREPAVLELVIIMIILLAIQVGYAWYRYKKFTSFHTYLAKLGAIFQGSFLILFFFLDEMPLTLFYVAAAITTLDLLEEIIMIRFIPEWRTDVKGLFWLKNTRKKELLPEENSMEA